MLANDSEGMMNYERPLQDMIVHTVKLIDKTLSGELTGTNVMPGDAQMQAIGFFPTLFQLLRPIH